MHAFKIYCSLFFFIATKKEKWTEKKNTLFTALPKGIAPRNNIEQNCSYVLSCRTKSIANLKNGSHAAPDFTNARRCFSRAERFLPVLGKNTSYRASGLVQCLMALLLISEFFFFGSFFLFASRQKEKMNK